MTAARTKAWRAREQVKKGGAPDIIGAPPVELPGALEPLAEGEPLAEPPAEGEALSAAPDGCSGAGLMDLPEEILWVLLPDLGTVGLSHLLAQTCKYMHKLPVLVEHLCGAWGIWVAAELARAERQAMLSERQRVQAAERMAFPVGAVVFGAPLARGLAVEEDYDLRVVVAAPTNSTDDYLLGYVPAGGTKFVVASVGQRRLHTTFMVVLRANQVCSTHPPPLLPHGWASPDTWRAEIARLRTGLVHYRKPHYGKRASPLRGPDSAQAFHVSGLE